MGLWVHYVRYSKGFDNRCQDYGDLNSTSFKHQYYGTLHCGLRSSCPENCSHHSLNQAEILMIPYILCSSELKTNNMYTTGALVTKQNPLNNERQTPQNHLPTQINLFSPISYI